MKTYDSAYPGSMIERKGTNGGYVELEDAESLAQGLLHQIRERDRKIEDLEDALKANDWRQAIDEALINAGLDCLPEKADAWASLKRLTDWVATMALDPLISEEAAALGKHSALLRKYLAHVGECEGTFFLGRSAQGVFTEDELLELHRVADTP